MKYTLEELQEISDGYIGDSYLDSMAFFALHIKDQPYLARLADNYIVSQRSFEIELEKVLG